MSTPINEAVATTVKRELAQLQNIVGLCAFAVESRRIHAEIDWAAKADAALAEKLSLMVDARCNWGEMPDTLAYVLVDVHDRLQELDSLMRSQTYGPDCGTDKSGKG